MNILSLLPSVNACLNGLSFILLITGWVAIKKGRQEFHKKCMLGALGTSALFLNSYLYYHFHVLTKRFPDIGLIKTLYLIMLGTHTILAVVMLPLIFMTFRFAFKQDWARHKKLARWTFPIWSYVSFTGVLIYMMLYQWFSN